MNEIIVYSVPGSPFGRTALATLEEKRATYRFVPVTSPRSAEHLALHPFGRVPVMEHQGFRLYETQAIQRYLDRVIDGPKLTPDAATAAARMDQVMNINDWYLFQGVGNVIVFQRIVAPRLMGAVPDEQAIAAAMPKAHRVLDELMRLLGDEPYFAGAQVSLADLLVAPQLDLLAQTPEWSALSASRQPLVDWLERMNARPSLRATTWEKVVALAAAAQRQH
jgi:glutathione S-transferase